MKRINPAVGVHREALAESFERHGRLAIHNFLDDSFARQLLGRLVAQKDWNLVYRVGGTHVDSDVGAVTRWPAAQRRKLEKAIYAVAAEEFQYRYATVPIYDLHLRGELQDEIYAGFCEFIGDDEFLSLMREISNCRDIAFADAQATRYGGGDFLTSHDDAIEDKHRVVAYVLGLTPVWRPDWGGALMYPDSAGYRAESQFPSFNTLHLFRVPTLHAVSFVSPFARGWRFSLSGWLRRPAPDR